MRSWLSSRDRKRLHLLLQTGQTGADKMSATTFAMSRAVRAANARTGFPVQIRAALGVLRECLKAAGYEEEETGAA